MPIKHYGLRPPLISEKVSNGADLLEAVQDMKEGGTIELVPGNVYELNAKLRLTKPVAITCEDGLESHTMIRFPSNMADAYGIEIAHNYVVLRGFTVDGQNHPTAYGIYATGRSRVHLDRILAWRWHTGFKTAGATWQVSMRDCYGAHCSYAEYYLVGATTLHMSRCYANTLPTNPSDFGFYLQGWSSANLLTCDGDNMTNPIYISATKQVNLVGCNIESSKDEPVYLQNCGAVTINGLTSVNNNSNDTAGHASVIRAVNCGAITINGVHEHSHPGAGHTNISHSIILEFTTQAKVGPCNLAYDIYNSVNYPWIKYAQPYWQNNGDTWAYSTSSIIIAAGDQTAIYTSGDLARIKMTVTGDGIYYAYSRIQAVTLSTDNTGDTDGSTAVITGLTDTSDFTVGSYVSVSAGFPTTGPFEILSKDATSITIDTNSDSAESNVTVTQTTIQLQTDCLTSGRDAYDVDYCPPAYYTHVRGTRKTVYGTAAPTLGTWAVGDEWVNITPSAGGAPGGINTTAGSPGTWKNRANVAA